MEKTTYVGSIITANNTPRLSDSFSLSIHIAKHVWSKHFWYIEFLLLEIGEEFKYIINLI